MSKYTEQADGFLTRNGLTIKIRRAKDTRAPWVKAGEKHGNKYRITLSGEDRRMSFDFWGSINAREKGTDPIAYDILACIGSDVHCPDTFLDFCQEYGYDEDSRSAEATFKRCAALAAKLNAFFTEAEIDQLGEIQ